MSVQMVHNDAGIWRVLEESKPRHWITLASYATEAEARSFIEGRSFRLADRDDVTRRTYDVALATVLKKGK